MTACGGENKKLLDPDKMEGGGFSGEYHVNTVVLEGECEGFDLITGYSSPCCLFSNGAFISSVDNSTKRNPVIPCVTKVAVVLVVMGTSD